MILITRPLAQAKSTVQKLQAKGYICKIYPVLSIETLSFDIRAKYDYVIISSQNAAQALCRKPEIVAKALVVGEVSAVMLRKHGYEVVLVASNVQDMYLKLTSTLTKSAKVIYLSGDRIAFPLDTKLISLGYMVERRIIYKAVPAKALPAEALKGVEKIMFYSPRTAHIFKMLAPSNLSNIEAICISQNTANKLAGMDFKAIKIAVTCNEVSMLELLDER